MLSLPAIFILFLVLGLGTLAVVAGRTGSNSARETGGGSPIIEEKTLDCPPEVTVGPVVAQVAQPWKQWLEAEMAGSGGEDRPWVNWKPNMEDPGEKPWLHWSNQRQWSREHPDGEEGPTTEMMGTYPVVKLDQCKG